jgi:poly(3-hydroxybutyrate) depolymerase
MEVKISALCFVFFLLIHLNLAIAANIHQFSLARPEGNRVFQVVTAADSTHDKVSQIVLFLHPWMSIQQDPKSGKYDFSRIFSAYGFWDLVDHANGSVAMILPVGLPGLFGNIAWNALECCQSNATIDDQAFIEEMISNVTKSPSEFGLNVQKNWKLFGAGFSNGAGFVQQLACMSSIPFSGIISVSGWGPFSPSDSNPEAICTNPVLENMSIFLVHGIADGVVGWNGHDGSVVPIVSFPQNSLIWAKVLNCRKSVPFQRSAGSIFKKHLYCNSNSSLKLVVSVGTGHYWVRAPHLDVTEEMAKFFGISSELSLSSSDSRREEGIFVDQSHHNSLSGTSTFRIYTDVSSPLFTGSNSSPKFALHYFEESATSEFANWTISTSNDLVSFQTVYNSCPRIYLSWNQNVSPYSYDVLLDCTNSTNGYVGNHFGSLYGLIAIELTPSLVQENFVQLSLGISQMSTFQISSVPFPLNPTLLSLNYPREKEALFELLPKTSLVPFLEEVCFSLSEAGNMSPFNGTLDVIVGCVNESSSLSLKGALTGRFCADSGAEMYRDGNVYLRMISALESNQLNFTLSIENAYCGIDSLFVDDGMTTAAFGPNCSLKALPLSSDKVQLKKTKDVDAISYFSGSTSQKFLSVKRLVGVSSCSLILEPRFNGGADSQSVLAI